MSLYYLIVFAVLSTVHFNFSLNIEIAMINVAQAWFPIIVLYFFIFIQLILEKIG